MKDLVSLSVLVLLLSTVPTPVCQTESPPSGQSPADVPINHDILVKSQPILVAFLDILRGTGMNAGFAEISGCSDALGVSLNLKQGATVGDALDALVAASPAYQWQLKDGVVDLLPRAGVPLLDTRIGGFQIDTTEHEAPAILGQLISLPEVQAHAAQLDLKPALGQGGPGVYEEHPPQSAPAHIHAGWQSSSLLDAFNRIVQMSRKAVWMYREEDCGRDKTYRVEAASDF